jgi:Na+/H+-dicarboxylate symporter
VLPRLMAEARKTRLPAFGGRASWCRPAIRSTSTAPTIYLTMAVLFIAQATNTDLSLDAAAHAAGGD